MIITQAGKALPTGLGLHSAMDDYQKNIISLNPKFARNLEKWKA